MAEDNFTIGPQAPLHQGDILEAPPEPEVGEKVTTKHDIAKPKPEIRSLQSEMMATLDTSFAEVLKYDSEGRIVRFACEPDRFLRLNDAQIDKLSAFNRGLYLDAERTNARLVEEARNPRLVGDIVQGGSATARLEVLNRKPGTHYFWATPDRVQRAVSHEGYKVVDDPNLQTFSRGPSGTKTVAAYGEVEHVLLEIPQETADARLKAVGAESTRRHLGAQAAGMASLGKGGYDPDKDPADTKRSWETRVPND